MALSNRECVGKSRELLKAGLGPFIDREFKNAHQDKVQPSEAVAQTRSGQP
jgi:hypothetical protein